MPITVITIGRKHEPWLIEGISRYEKRLQVPFIIRWVLLQNSNKKGVDAAREESEAIMRRLSPPDFIILLDESGKMLDSIMLSKTLSQHLDQSKHIICIIGGAYGVSQELRARADLMWSLSKLVFPHQMVRLLLVEQLYRAQTIERGVPYHNQ